MEGHVKVQWTLQQTAHDLYYLTKLRSDDNRYLSMSIKIIDY